MTKSARHSSREQSPYPLKIFSLLSLLLLLVSCDSSSSDREDDSFPSLKQVAPFAIGVAIQASHAENQDRVNSITHAFDNITAEYQMKQNITNPIKGQFAWNESDRIVNFATDNGMKVHGHALVWYQSTPGWVQSFTGSDQEFEDEVRSYINSVMSRYAGKSVTWDVVNEAFEDGGTGRMREFVFRDKMGDDYIAKLFQMAHEADPSALLFYNDYGMTYDSAKRRGMLDMLEDFVDRGVPIHGVGLQMHLTNNTSNQQISDLINQVAATGLKVHLSEIDIRVNEDGSMTSPSQDALVKQSQKLVSMINDFRAIPQDQQFAITFWGLRDPDSWLINFWGNPEWGLLFDANYRPKPAYCGLYSALGGTEECVAG